MAILNYQGVNDVLFLFHSFSGCTATIYRLGIIIIHELGIAGHTTINRLLFWCQCYSDKESDNAQMQMVDRNFIGGSDI